MRFDADVTELLALEQDLRHAPMRVQRRVPAVVDQAAANVERGWRDNARRTAGRHGRHYPASIDHDASWVAGGYEARVGPRNDRPQGSMGPGFEYGSVNQPPHLDGNQAADVELPRFEKALADLAGEIL